MHVKNTGRCKELLLPGARVPRLPCRAASRSGDIAVAAGSGNNGGDGFALARILKLKGVDCRVVTLSDKLPPDSAHSAAKAKDVDGPGENA